MFIAEADRQNEKIYEAGPDRLLRVAAPLPLRLYPLRHAVRLFREARPDDPEDPHLHPLFTPLRPSPRPFTPLSLHDSHCLRLHPTAFPFDPTSEPIEIQESFRSDPEINEKLEFSEEQPIPITPEKLRGVVEEGQTTARKSSQWAGEGKFYERGLKKLAYEAFRFVSNQKKTTYKEVATKLINQLNDDNELDIHVRTAPRSARAR